jgi:hypothetical protein
MAKGCVGILNSVFSLTRGPQAAMDVDNGILFGVGMGGPEQ